MCQPESVGWRVEQGTVTEYALGSGSYGMQSIFQISEKHLSLWAVNDLSDRRTLLHYPLRLRKLKRYRRGQLLRVESAQDEGEENTRKNGLTSLKIPLPA